MPTRLRERCLIGPTSIILRVWRRRSPRRRTAPGNCGRQWGEFLYPYVKRPIPGPSDGTPQYGIAFLTDTPGCGPLKARRLRIGPSFVAIREASRARGCVTARSDWDASCLDASNSWRLTTRFKLHHSIIRSWWTSRRATTATGKSARDARGLPLEKHSGLGIWRDCARLLPRISKAVHRSDVCTNPRWTV